MTSIALLVRRRSARLPPGLLAISLALIAAISAAQESWDRPVRIDGIVLDENKVPIAGAGVSLRTFVRPLETTAQRRAAFDSLAAMTRTDSAGRWALTLPPWTLAYATPLAVVVSKDGLVGSREFVYPYRRETHHGIDLRLIVSDRGYQSRDTQCWARIVDEAGSPLVDARVAALVGVATSSKVRHVGFGVIYSDNLIVGMESRTDHEGWVNVSSAVWIALVERSSDVIPVVIRPQWRPVSDVVARRVFDVQAADETISSALTDQGDSPPSREEAAKVLREKFAGTGVVEGIVVGPDGRPLVGAQVAVIIHDAKLDPFASIRMKSERINTPFTRTEASGRFRVEKLRAGRYRLQVAAPDLAPKVTSSFRLREAEDHAAGEVQLQRGARLVVRGSWGMVRFGETAYVELNGPTGEVRGLPQGLVHVRTWNGACCVSQSIPVRIPSSGAVSVDFTGRGIGFLRAY